MPVNKGETYMKSPLILVVSSKMDSNKKKGRNEDRLIRMGSKTRANLGLTDEKTVELWPDTGEVSDRINRSKALEIFQAYAGDLKKLKDDNMSANEYFRVGFVTSRTFDYICRDKHKKKENIWIADTIEDTVIGGDPEFLLGTKEGHYQYASYVRGFRHSDELGSDGPWAEIRPQPTIGVDDFVDNIQDILRNHPNVKLIEEYKWISGCYYYGGQPPNGSSARSWPLGGHIHIGNPAKLVKAMNSAGNSYRNSVFACLQKIMDEYIAIPLMRLDGLDNSTKRRSEFGYYGDIRVDHGRLEYRTLSSEWLNHPALTAAVIGTAKAISHAFFRSLENTGFNPKAVMTKSMAEGSSDINIYRFFDASFCYWKNIELMREFKTIKNSSTMIDILNSAKMEFNQAFFKSHKSLIKSLSTYKEYAEHLDAFLEIIALSDDDLASIPRDLKKGWVGGDGFII